MNFLQIIKSKGAIYFASIMVLLDLLRLAVTRDIGEFLFLIVTQLIIFAVYVLLRMIPSIDEPVWFLNKDIVEDAE